MTFFEIDVIKCNERKWVYKKKKILSVLWGGLYKG